MISLQCVCSLLVRLRIAGFLVSPRRLLILCAGALAALSLLVAPAGRLAEGAPAVAPVHRPGDHPDRHDVRRHYDRGSLLDCVRPEANVYYTLSDDQSQINPARFYTSASTSGRASTRATSTSRPSRRCNSLAAVHTRPAASTPKASR